MSLLCMLGIEISGTRSGWAVRLGVCTAVLSGACGGPSGEGAASPRSSTSSAATTSQALTRARRAKADAEALAPPTVPPNLDRQRALEWVGGPLRDWIQSRVARSEAAS